MKQTVLFVHNYYKIPGGEDTVVENERRLFEEHGFRVICYTRKNEEIDHMSTPQKIRAAFESVYSFRTVREVSELIRQEKVSLVIVHNTLSLISASVYDAALRCKVPVLQVVHNFRFLCPNGVFYRNGHICEDCVKKGMFCALSHRCYRGSLWQTALVILALRFHRLRGIYGKISYVCLTEFNRKKLLSLPQIRPEQVFVKPNFTDFTGDRIPYEKRENRLVFVGRLDRLKGVALILKAWRRMGKDAPELWMAGTGPLEEQCKEYIRKHSLSKVKLLGFVNHEDCLKLMGESKALLMPSRWYEGFPMTMAEAFAVGTPVIGSGFGNVGDLIGSPGLGVKIELPCGVQELVTAVKRFREEYRYEEQAFREAAGRYGSEENWRKITEILGEMIG